MIQEIVPNYNLRHVLFEKTCKFKEKCQYVPLKIKIVAQVFFLSFTPVKEFQLYIKKSVSFSTDSSSHDRSKIHLLKFLNKKLVFLLLFCSTVWYTLKISVLSFLKLWKVAWIKLLKLISMYMQIIWNLASLHNC